MYFSFIRPIKKAYPIQKFKINKST